ncbi:MAG: tol-pal system protein YbgF [Gammaproteobacteria bacterium]
MSDRARYRSLLLLLTCTLLAGAGGTAGAQERAPVTSLRDARGAAVPAARPVDPQVLFELANQVERLQAEVSRLRGELESQRHDAEQQRTRQREQLVDFDRRLQAVERGGVAQAGAGEALDAPLRTLAPAQAPPVAGAVPAAGLAIETQPAAQAAAADEPDADARAQGIAPITQAAGIPPAAAPAPQAAPAPEPTAAQAPADPAADQAYKSAFNLLKAGKYDDAIAAFNNYLVEYPGAASADSAQFWLGEAYYVTRQYQAAIGEYQKLLNAYPRSQKAPNALLKLGFAYQELGKPDLARTRLEQVRSAYPGTTAARLADERLRQLGAPKSRS